MFLLPGPSPTSRGEGESGVGGGRGDEGRLYVHRKFGSPKGSRDTDLGV